MQIAWQFDKITLKKMGVSALLLVAGAFLTFLADNALKLVGAVGIPPNVQPLVLAAFTWLVNTVKEWIKGQE
jgi:hypothetical protein